MANTFTPPVFVRAKPHSSAEKQVGDADPNARTDVINRVDKGVYAVLRRLINTLFDGATADFTDQTTVSALAGTFLLGGAKIVTFSRNMATASGTQAVTGVGFTPRYIEFDAANGDEASGFSNGCADGTSNMCMYGNRGGGVGFTEVSTTECIRITGSAGQRLGSVLTSFDADGFTVTHTKVGAATGTAAVIAKCFR